MHTSLRILPALSFALALAMPFYAGAQDVHRVSFTQGKDTSYALVREGQQTTFVGRYDSDENAVDKLKQQFSGNFIWYRHAGKAYVVRDPATLNQIAAAWAPVEPISADMHRLEAKMRVQGDVMKALGQEMEAATHGTKAANMDALGKQMEAQGKQMDGLGKEMDAIGKQMEVQSKWADTTTRKLLEASISNGRAQALPIRE